MTLLLGEVSTAGLPSARVFREELEALMTILGECLWSTSQDAASLASDEGKPGQLSLYVATTRFQAYQRRI